jgi:hypothetical protein
MAIKELLDGKDAKEKANIKGVEIAKVLKKKKYRFDKKDKKWK